jgi:hypothetical protein
MPAQSKWGCAAACDRLIATYRPRERRRMSRAHGKSRRPWNVITAGTGEVRARIGLNHSRWPWMRSNSRARSRTIRMVSCRYALGSSPKPRGRSARGTVAISRPGMFESPVAKVVTSCPRATSSRTRPSTTRSVPPYPAGGTASSGGATCAMRSLGPDGASMPPTRFAACSSVNTPPVRRVGRESRPGPGLRVRFRATLGEQQRDGCVA